MTETTLGERMRTELINEDCIDPSAEFENWLQELVDQGDDAGLTMNEMHEIMVKVHEDNV